MSIACGYADGSLTLEQAILAGFARGYCCRQTKDKLIKGMMAAVALSKDQITKMLPEGVYVGCQNSSSSVTITGPEEITRSFLEELKANGIFTKIVNANLPFHSKHVQEAGKYLLDFLGDIIKNPQSRSSKWISTSVPPEYTLTDWSMKNCPEYHFNNFCNPVLFEQVFQHVPENAIVIEVAPHGLLQAILKREFSSNVCSVSISSKNTIDNEKFFLSAIGR